MTNMYDVTLRVCPGCKGPLIRQPDSDIAIHADGQPTMDCLTRADWAALMPWIRGDLKRVEAGGE